jgi:hypothetical protein
LTVSADRCHRPLAGASSTTGGGACPAATCTSSSSSSSAPSRSARKGLKKGGGHNRRGEIISFRSSAFLENLDNPEPVMATRMDIPSSMGVGISGLFSQASSLWFGVAGRVACRRSWRVCGSTTASAAPTAWTWRRHVPSSTTMTACRWGGVGVCGGKGCRAPKEVVGDGARGDSGPVGL